MLFAPSSWSWSSSSSIFRSYLGAGSCWCCHANLAYRRNEEGIKRDALLTAQASGGLGSLNVRRRRQGCIADVSKASRFILSFSDPHSGALRPIVVSAVKKKTGQLPSLFSLFIPPSSSTEDVLPSPFLES
jgi:hypothetical protein